MLSKSCVYALRSIVFIACNATAERKLGIKEIGEELDLPTPYLGKILQILTRNQIIKGVKGPNGGFYLQDSCKKVKIIKIIEVMDGLDFFTSCGLGLKECSDSHPCPLHDDFKVYRDGLWELFSNKAIEDIVVSVNEGNTFIKNVSSIK